MQLLIFLMAASSASTFECACRGVRGEGVGWEELCALGVGGNITAEYVYELEVRPTVRGNLTLTQALAKMQSERSVEASAAMYSQLRDRAQFLQDQEGGLYRGSNSGTRGSECVRSVFCSIDGGRHVLERACCACWLVQSMPAIHRRAVNRAAALATDAPTSNGSSSVNPKLNHRFDHR